MDTMSRVLLMLFICKNLCFILVVQYYTTRAEACQDSENTFRIAVDDGETDIVNERVIGVMLESF